MLSNLPKTPKGGLSQVKEMSPYEIIEDDINEFNLKLDPKQTYAAVLKMVQKPNYRIVRANNTLLILDNHGNGSGEGMIFSADGPQTFVTSLRQLNKALKTAGLKSVTFSASGMAIEPLMKRAGLNYTIRDAMLKIGGEKRKGQIITVTE